jgi:hypothetical protein
MDKYQDYCQNLRRVELQDLLLGQFFGAVIATDTRGIVTYINEHGRTLTKWNGQIDGMTHFREIVRIQDGTSGTPLENIADRILTEKKIFWMPPNANLIALDKSPVPAMGSASPLADASGRVLGMMVVLFPMSNPMYLEFQGRPLY